MDEDDVLLNSFKTRVNADRKNEEK